LKTEFSTKEGAEQGVPVGNLIRLANEAESRNVSVYERSLQPDLVGAGIIVPIAGLVGSRDPGPSASD
jgi:hypothetical protein